MQYQKYQFENLTIYHRNLEELKLILDEKFVKGEYSIDLKTNEPFIIDAGAHIGIATLYFKKLYPKCHIIAFEPDSTNYEILLANIKVNKLDNVECINAALADNNGEQVLMTSPKTENPWTWGNTIINDQWGPNDPDYNKPVKVKTVKLSNYISQPVDLLKLDVEGAETMIIRDLKPKLHFIKNIFLEYHGTKYNTGVNNLNEIEDILNLNNFEFSKSKIDLLSLNVPQDYIEEAQLEQYTIKAENLRKDF